MPLHSPLRTPPTRSFPHDDDIVLRDMAALPSLHDSSSRFSKKPHDTSLSILDQLHAEQKSTIEALTYQIEFYRQREDRSKKEIETLRKFLQDGGNNEALNVARLARETRTLGDEVDALRGKQAAWSEEKRRWQRREHELEQQLQDARLSLTTVTQAVEQLELKIQRRDAEEQTRALEMEQELRQRDEDCTQLRRQCNELHAQIATMQAAIDENEQLRRQVQSLFQGSTTQRAEAEATSEKLQNEMQELHKRISEAEALNRQRELTVIDLQTKLVQATSEASSLRVEIEKKVADIRELDQKLQRSTDLLELREKLLTSDTSSRQEQESQRIEFRQQINALEREKADLQHQLALRDQQLRTTEQDMAAVKARLTAKDHGVMITTLRSEVAGVKDRLRAEFKHEKDVLLAEKASLSKEIALLNARLTEKERFVHRLQDEMLEKESNGQHLSHEVNTLKSTIHRLEKEVTNWQNKYQQLLDARSSLADQLDYGFKELLQDENTAASLLPHIEKLEEELNDTRQQLGSSEARRNAVLIELETLKQERENESKVLRKKIDELYEDLRKNQEGTFAINQLEMKVHLLEQEKQQFETVMSNMRTQLEDQTKSEQQTFDKLQNTLSVLKNEKAQQHAKIIAIEDEVGVRDAKLDELKLTLKRRDYDLQILARDKSALQEQIHHFEVKLAQANDMITASKEDKVKRERKLLRERRVLEDEVAKLVNRIETASLRNGELGEKIIELMKQLKGYEAESVAFKTQLKAEKQKRNDLDRALATLQRSTGQEAESAEDIKRRFHEMTSLKESYQAEVNQLKRSLDRAQSEKDLLHRQRDEAIKRVSMLMKCQEQMKSTVESHTSELVEEIETLQVQLDDERKRTTVLLANEKTLLRDITEKNSVITRLQQTVEAFQEQETELSRGAATGLRKSSPRDGRYSSFPTSTSPTSGKPITPSTRNSSEVSSSTQELDRILGSLERISEFSPRSPSASFSTR